MSMIKPRPMPPKIVKKAAQPHKVLKRTPLAKVSKTKEVWNKKYLELKAEMIKEQIKDKGYSYCEICKQPAMVEGHHINGRASEQIMVFILICRLCHTEIHTFPNQARAKGWLK